MEKLDLDLLLQARTSELQHEYENLVRSLDAAYEAVKAIGRDIAENRAEARRLFDTRLKLARGDDLEAVLRLCSSGDATEQQQQQQPRNCHQSKTNNGSIRKNAEQLPGMLRLYVQQSDATSTIGRQQQAHVDAKQQPSRVVTVTSAANEAMPRLRPIKQIQPFDAAPLLIEQLQQQHKQHDEQPHYSPVYVGDDHSYAVNEEEEEELAEHQLMLEEGLMVDAGDAKRSTRSCRDNHTAGVDLSIVKTEIPDNSIEEQNPLGDHQQKLVKPTITKTSKLAGPLSRRAARLRKIGEVEVDDEIIRKRKQTRERMRRWRAKKKMEELNAKQPYKYKLVIAKT